MQGSLFGQGEHEPWTRSQRLDFASRVLVRREPGLARSPFRNGLSRHLRLTAEGGSGRPVLSIAPGPLSDVEDGEEAKQRENQNITSVRVSSSGSGLSASFCCLGDGQTCQGETMKV